MSFFYYNANPYNRSTNDCTIRAVSVLLDQSWDKTFDDICEVGRMMKDMPSTNRVWGKYLRMKGYRPHFIPDSCPDCYTVRDFCYDHPYGKFLLSVEGHVVAVIDGHYYDTWDSGDEVPFYYWSKEKTNAKS